MPRRRGHRHHIAVPGPHAWHIIELHPDQLRFTQDACSCNFGDGTPLVMIWFGLHSRMMTANELPMMHVVPIGKHMFCCDNRRLCVLRLASFSDSAQLIRCWVLCASQRICRRALVATGKHDTTSHGRRIYVRMPNHGARFVIGRTIRSCFVC